VELGCRLHRGRHRDPPVHPVRPDQSLPQARGGRGHDSNPAPRQWFAGAYEGSWIESRSRRWRRKISSAIDSGAARKGKSMYIGIGTVVLIIIIVLVVLMLRRR
jgi:hypothetical protein